MTGSSDFAARNFGLDGMPPHDMRYDIADEYMEVARKLWGSWEPGAIIADRERGMLVDHTKVHAIDHQGTHFKVRGPLNSGPCLQGQPVIAQAGGSPRGRRIRLAPRRHIVAMVKGTAGMKAYRDDIRAPAWPATGATRMTARCCSWSRPCWATPRRRPGPPQAAPVAATTEEQIAQRLAHLSKITNLDFGALPLDQPLGS